MKDTLDSLIEGRDDGRNGWINKRRMSKDRAYAVGVAMGECEYRQFLAGPPNPPPGYTPPPLPKDIQDQFLAMLAKAKSRMLISEESPREKRLSEISEADLLGSPIADLSFARVAAIG